METITLDEHDKKSSLSRAWNFLKEKKTRVLGSAILIGSLVGGGAGFGSLEAKAYDYYREGNHNIQKGKLVELVCETVQGDYDNDNYLDPFLKVVGGEQEGLLVKLRQREMPGNKGNLMRARRIINRSDKLVTVFGQIVDSRYYDFIVVDPEFLAFSDYDGHLYDTVYTDADTRDIGWIGTYRPYFNSLDWWGFSPIGGGFWGSIRFWDRYALWEDWDYDGIPNIFDPTPRGSFRNPYAHWNWFNFHQHHRHHFGRDGKGGYKVKPIIVGKDRLRIKDRNQRGFRIIRKDSLTPQKSLVERIKREHPERAIKRRSSDNKDYQVRQESRAVRKKSSLRDSQSSTPQRRDDNKPVKKKDDDKKPFMSSYSGSRDYLNSQSFSARNSSPARFRYVPRNERGVVKKEYKTDFSGLRARTPVYRNNSNSRDDRSRSSGSVYRRNPDASSGRVRTYVPKSNYSATRSYRPSTPSTRSHSSSSSSRSSRSRASAKKR